MSEDSSHPGNSDNIPVDDRNWASSNEIANRLKQAVRQAGGPAKVARRSHVNLASLNTYLAGREMRASTMVALADACGVSVEWLATGREFKLPGEMATMVVTQSDIDVEVRLPMHRQAQRNESENLGHPLTAYVPIPRYETRVSAGRGEMVTEENRNGYLALEETFLSQTLGRHSHDLVCIEAAGDSMEPSIHDGDLLVIDTSVQTIQSSRVYVLSIKVELLVKRLSLRLDGSIMVRSDNAKYPDEIVVPSERNELRIVGQVIYQAGPVRS